MADVSSEEQEEEKRTDYSHDEEPRISLLLNKVRVLNSFLSIIHAYRTVA